MGISRYFFAFTCIIVAGESIVIACIGWDTPHAERRSLREPVWEIAQAICFLLLGLVDFLREYYRDHDVEKVQEGDVEETTDFKQSDIVRLKDGDLGRHIGVDEETDLHVSSIDEETGIVRCWWVREDGHVTYEGDFDPETLEYAD